MTTSIESTELWHDASELPETVAATLRGADGGSELVDLLASPATRRVVATGNGASWYVAHSFWLASIDADLPFAVVAVPAGLVAAHGFAWRDGDVMLAFSASGELRDLVEAVGDGSLECPLGLVTSSPTSSLGRTASALSLVTVRDQRARTHTQAYLGAMVASACLVGRLSKDPTIADALGAIPDVLAGQLAEAPRGLDASFGGGGRSRSATVFGTNHAWPGALEASLLLKEVSGIPAEGMETREGATSGMYALRHDDLAVALPVGDDPLATEALRLCASRGAAALACPWPPGVDPRLAALAHFVHPLALSIGLALAAGSDPDHPSWHAAYESTARSAGEGGRARIVE